MMNHIDEGTIHEWLDGAVDATQAREIEAHVAQCSTCATAVAEARGFVAASSRILTALDDVPAGVAPTRAPSAPKRQWRAAPWVTGIAAALILAVGVTTWNRDVVRNEMATKVEPLTPKAQGAPPLTQRQPVTVPVTVPVASGRGAGGAAPPPAVTDVARRDSVAPARKVQATLHEPKLESVAAADVPAVSLAKEAPAPSAPPVASAVAQKRSDETADVERVAGCYRVPRSVSRSVMPSAGAVANAVAERARAAAPSRSRASVDYVAPLAPSMLRLDTLRHPLGHVARAAASDSAAGWWTRLDDDSVRIDLLAAGVFTFAAKDRVACPER